MLSSVSWGLHFSSFASISTHLPPWHYSKKFRRAPSLRKVKYSAITSLYEHKPLPYPVDSLEPHLSRDALSYHWGKHHRAHVESLNKLLEGYEVEAEKSLEQFIVDAYNKGNPLPAFNHAAQIWNHEFFWNSMKPNGGGRPSGVLMDLIKRDFGSFNKMLLEFKNTASIQFGSGWVWLVYKANKLDVGNAVNPRPKEEDNKLLILKSPNAVNPLVWDYSPLLGIDIWEHAYYLDYESRRADYVSVFMNKLVSWEVVSSRLEMAVVQAEERTRQAERNEDEEAGDGVASEVYLDSENDSSDAE